MAKLTEEVKKVISEFGPALLATTTNNEKPNVSVRGSFRVVDDEHVVYTDISKYSVI